MPNVISAQIKVDGNAALNSFNDLGKSIRNNVALGNLMATGLTAAMGTISGAVGGMISAFGESSDIIQENISTAGDFAKLSGVSFDEAGGFIDDFSVRMAKAAASLPGVTSGYIGIGKSLTDELIPSFLDASGALDKDGMAESLDKLSIAAGIRADAAGVTISESGRAIAKLLGGQTTMAELSRLDFFEKNKAVLSTLKKELEGQGKELKDLSSKEILTLTQTALDVSDDVIAASSASVGGMIDGFKSGLFDPTSGAFGFMREIDGRSVMDAAAGALKRLIGPTGIFYKIGKIAEGLGLNADPAAMLIGGIDAVTGWLDKIDTLLSAFRSKIDRGVISGLAGFDTGQILLKISGAVGTFFNKISGAFANLNTAEVSRKIGGVLAKIVDAAARFIVTLDFAKLGLGIIKVGLIAVNSLVEMVKQIDFVIVGRAFLKLALVAGAAIGASFLASANAVVVAFFSLSAPVLAAIASGAILIVGGIQKIWAAAGDYLSRIGSAISDLFANMLDGIRNLFTLNGGGDKPGRGGRPKNKATGLDQIGLFAAMAAERSAMPAGSNLVIANDSEAIFNRSQQGVLLNALTQRGGITINAPITINGTGLNPDAIAASVIRKLNSSYRQFAGSQLSAAL